MKAHVYFKQDRNNDVKRVAEVEIPSKFNLDEALEFVYCRLQNIQGSWSMGPNFEECGGRMGLDNLDHSECVKFVGEYPVNSDGCKMGERSMMMGDLINYDGKTYEVAMFGFDEYQEAV